MKIQKAAPTLSGRQAGRNRKAKLTVPQGTGSDGQLKKQKKKQPSSNI